MGGFASSLKGGAGPSLFWSDVTVEGRPRVLILDATGDREGWEADATARIADSLVRRDIPVISGAPVQVGNVDDLEAAVTQEDDFNCVFVSARAAGDPSAAQCWTALNSALSRRSRLFAMCTWDTADREAAEAALKGEDTFAPVAVVQEEPMSGRGASLFFMKFFAELDLHSESSNSMTGKMVWFGHSKAREIMRRRKYEGRVGLRA